MSEWLNLGHTVMRPPVFTARYEADKIIPGADIGSEILAFRFKRP